MFPVSEKPDGILILSDIRNGYLLKRFCDMSDIDVSLIKYSDAYQQALNLGAIAA